MHEEVGRHIWEANRGIVEAGRGIMEACGTMRHFRGRGGINEAKRDIVEVLTCITIVDIMATCIWQE